MRLALEWTDADAGAPTTSRLTDRPLRIGRGLDNDIVLTHADVSGRTHTVDAENRALLVWILARRLADDRAGGAAEAGWCADADVRVGIWGAQARDQLDNNLSVVISRTRRELAEHGFDGRCIDRRRGETRLVVGEGRVGRR